MLIQKINNDNVIIFILYLLKYNFLEVNVILYKLI